MVMLRWARVRMIGTILVAATTWSATADANERERSWPRAASPAKDLLDEIRKRAPHDGTVDFRWTTGHGGVLTGLFGSPLQARLVKSRVESERDASATALRVVDRFRRSLGVASADALAVTGVQPNQASRHGTRRWTVRIQRLHEGLVVWNEHLTLIIGDDGSLRGLQSSFTSASQSVSNQTQSRTDSPSGNAYGLWSRTDGADGPQLDLVVLNSETGRVVRYPTGEFLVGLEVDQPSSFDTVVTSRHIFSQATNSCGPMTADSCAVQPMPGNINPAACADGGRAAWSSFPTVQNPSNPAGPLIMACCAEAQPNCAPSDTALCQQNAQNKLYGPEVLSSVNALEYVRSQLAANGISTLSPPNSPDFPIVLSPSSAPSSANDVVNACSPCPNGDLACPAANPQNPCAGADLDGAKCAMAFRALVGWELPTCAPAVSATAGLIMLSEAAQSAPSVIAHEIGHLWQRGHGIWQPDPLHLIGQPAAIGESIADAMALVASPGSWLIGAESQCAGYRNACRPDCSSPGPSEPDPTCVAGPPAVQDPQDPNKLINVCASAQPRHFRDFQILPGGAAGDPAKAKDSIGGNAHFNSGILNFAHFLFASGYTHLVGNQTIAPQTNNQGRLALGNILSRYPEKLGSALAQSVASSAPGGTPVPAIVQQMQKGNWTYDGAREAMIQAALDIYPNSSTPHELARSYDAVGIWRPENEVDMFGIDRVAMLPVTTPGAQQAAGPDGIMYLVNYDGARRNVMTRCVKQMVGVSCGTPVDIELPFVYQPNPPYGAPAAISMPDGTGAIIYPTASGQLAWQMFDENGPTVSQMIDDANTPQPTTLFGPTWPLDANGNVDSIRALGIGASYTPPANGAQFGDGPWIAYLCADAACTCNGAAGLVANGAVICVRNAAGTNEKVIQTTIAIADVRRDHSPALVLSNGVLTVIWVQPDVNLPVGVERVFYASRIDAANFFNWTVPQAWHTAGEAGLHDFPTFTHSAIAAASLPGAGLGPLDEPQDRVYLQYKPETVGLGSQLPNNEAANAQANYKAVTGGGRAYCFASGVFGAGATLAKQSMGVGQNRDGVSVLEGAPAATQGSLGVGAVAGGFVNWAGRTYAAIRVTSTGGQPTGPAYYWDHSVNPLYYGPLLLRSVGWR